MTLAIRLAGETVNHLPPFKRRVNTVFQSYALFPHMSVAQNIAFGLEMQGLLRHPRSGRSVDPVRPDRGDVCRQNPADRHPDRHL